nr:hypothetical protein CFP56_78284 [Quercus suber]
MMMLAKRWSKQKLADMATGSATVRAALGPVPSANLPIRAPAYHRPLLFASIADFTMMVVRLILRAHTVIRQETHHYASRARVVVAIVSQLGRDRSISRLPDMSWSKQEADFDRKTAGWRSQRLNDNATAGEYQWGYKLRRERSFSSHQFDHSENFKLKPGPRDFKSNYLLRSARVVRSVQSRASVAHHLCTVFGGRKKSCGAKAIHHGFVMMLQVAGQVHWWGIMQADRRKDDLRRPCDRKAEWTSSCIAHGLSKTLASRSGTDADMTGFACHSVALAVLHGVSDIQIVYLSSRVVRRFVVNVRCEFHHRHQARGACFERLRWHRIVPRLERSGADDCSSEERVRLQGVLYRWIPCSIRDPYEEGQRPGGFKQRNKLGDKSRVGADQVKSQDMEDFVDLGYRPRTCAIFACGDLLIK